MIDQYGGSAHTDLILQVMMASPQLGHLTKLRPTTTKVGKMVDLYALALPCM